MASPGPRFRIPESFVLFRTNPSIWQAPPMVSVFPISFRNTVTSNTESTLKCHKSTGRIGFNPLVKGVGVYAGGSLYDISYWKWQNKVSQAS
jgi:hypothetical protein